MDIYKSFYVETTNDGKSRIYNVGEKFFSGKGKSAGLMERFGSFDLKKMNSYINRLNKEGWLPLSMEDIKQISINELGIITAYPFKHRKGYMKIEKIEAIARKTGFVWKRADHDTNPFSVILDYSDLINELTANKDYDVKSLIMLVNNFSSRLNSIGAIDVLENFFTEIGFVPDPRRFNKTAKELWTYYRRHLIDCCRLVCMGYLNANVEDFTVIPLIAKLQEMESLQQLITKEVYSRLFK